MSSKISIAAMLEAEGCLCAAATLDGLLLRVLPAVIYSIPFYPMIRFQSDPAHVALFFCVLAVFSATVGALSMAITVGFGTAGKAALIMNLVSLLPPQCRPSLLKAHHVQSHHCRAVVQPLLRCSHMYLAAPGKR